MIIDEASKGLQELQRGRVVGRARSLQLDKCDRVSQMPLCGSQEAGMFP
jgi:hypothetical protein